MSVVSKYSCGSCSKREEFRRYKNADGKLIGIYCKSCNTEWLKTEYLAQQNTPSDEVDFPHDDDEKLHKNIPIQPDVKKAFQVQSARTKIPTNSFVEVLKPGDHVTWQRIAAYWHHAIVSQVNADKNEIVVIEWTKEGNRLGIFEKPLTMKATGGGKLFNQMYRIDYSEDIAKANKAELVLARARSRINDTGYGLFGDNCEAFATYCKTGCAKSHQVTWIIEKIKETCGISTLKTFAKNGWRFLSGVADDGVTLATAVIPAEVTEEASTGSEVIGAGIVILFETGFVIKDVGQIYQERKKDNISKPDFVEATVRRIVEGVTSAGCAITSSIVAEIVTGMVFGLAFGPIGAIVGGIIGGLVGGRVMGTWNGSFAGKVIAYCFPNGRALLKSQ